MKKVHIPSFDEMKDKRFNYHYSREERLRLRRSFQPEQPEEPKGFLQKIFGKNKMFIRMILFFIAFSALAWVLFFVYETNQILEKQKTVKFPHNRQIVVKLIQNPGRYGLNLSFENHGKESWVIHSLRLELSNHQAFTNVMIKVLPEQFDYIFIPFPMTVSNIYGLDLKINTEE